MSWRFPRYDLNDQDVIDYHAWNENALPFVDEASGKLNEHNFALNAFNAPASWADDVGFRLHHVDVEVDPNGTADGSLPAVGVTWVQGRRQDGSGYNTHHVPADFARLTLGSAWQRIEDMLLEFVTPEYGAQLWIQFSGQFEVWPSDDVGNDRVPTDSEFGIMVSFRVDGAIIYECLLGSGELDNDLAARIGDKTTAPGIYGRRYPVAMDTVIDVPPGTHTVEVVVYSESADYNRSYYVSNREFFVLEMF